MIIRDTNIKIDRNNCIACGVCVDRCVMDNLRLSVALCRQVCPLHINCQGVVRLVAKGKEHQAVELLSEFLPFMGILGLLCHAPCEKACARKKVDRPVQIRTVYGYLINQMNQHIEEIYRQVSHRQSGKNIAIWGSGPAAMMATWSLRCSGHSTTMFEPKPEPGGALRNYASRSDDHAQALSKMIDAIQACGNDLKTGIEFPDFMKQSDRYDAMILTFENDKELSRILERSDIDESSFEFDPETLQVVGQKEMFVCRDLDSNQSRIVKAFANGKATFESVHRFINEVPLMWERGFWEAQGNVKDYLAPFEKARNIESEKAEALPVRKGGEDQLSIKQITKAEAVYEGERCLSCGRPFDSNQTCWYCLPCEIECPHKAIEVQIPYLLR